MKYLDRYKDWLKSEYISDADKHELISIKEDPEEIRERFYKELEFGTGGLRGIMGMGSDRMNIYTVRKVTQGYANALNKHHIASTGKSIAIAYDTRHSSDIFAKQAALVLAANGIKAYLFNSPRPTPMLSFAIRHIGCSGGIVITASHNTSQYNGYKAYSRHGVQITPSLAKNIMHEITLIKSWGAINIIDEKTALANEMLKMISPDVDEAYYNNVCELALSKRISGNQSGLKIVYTPLHGTGLAPVTKCLERLGYSDIYPVESQSAPDGDFPTVKSPNPEERAAFTLAIETAEKIDADIILATDPDCDRIGIATKNTDGQYQVLTGNQAGALMSSYIMHSSKGSNLRNVIIKTIVTSELGAQIARSYGAEIIDTLTGFKFIGETAQELESDPDRAFLFGYEESCGYLAGNFVRDKDAVIAACLAAEMTAYNKSLGISLYEALNEIYSKFGLYIDDLQTFVFKGAQGRIKRREIMAGFRDYQKLFDSFSDISCIKDYLTGSTIYKDGSQEKDIELLKSDVIKIIFDDRSWIALRPSGTEPKIKVYYSMIGFDHGHREIMQTLIDGQ